MKRWIATGLTVAAAFQLWAQAPEMFRYQGRLVDSTNLVNATLPMSFKLYDALSGGNKLYEDASSVLVVDGLYSTMIGDNTVFGSLTNAMTNTAVYLELTVNSSTLSPRERLVSVPYALNAPAPHTPERIIGLSSDALDFGNALTGTTKTATLTIYNDGDSVMTVAGLQYSDSRFSGNWSGKVRQYSSTNITVTFAPVSVQGYSGTVTVNCDKTSGTNTVAITGTGIAVRYVDNGDGTVSDICTGLMWMKNADSVTMAWADAVAYCDNLVTNGYSDWRLPSVAQDGGTAELDMLFRANGTLSGSWDGSAGTPFTCMQNSYYWSGTSYEAKKDYAWNVCIGKDSFIVWGLVKSANLYVWPVRGGTTYTPERIIELSGTLDFGNCSIGETNTAILTIYNYGNGAMTVTSLQYSDAHFSGNWAGILPAGSSTNVTVTFAPVLGQSYSGTITVNCDKTSGINSIACTGTGVTIRYVDNGNGTVTDIETGLMWTKNANLGSMTWTDAVAYCDNLVTNGYSDWRLPSVAHDGGVAELDTLFRVKGNPSGVWEGCEGTPFIGVHGGPYGYWSSTSVASNTAIAWGLYIFNGIVYDNYTKTYNVQYVWPVRGGQ